jgi:hypothetical protein
MGVGTNALKKYVHFFPYLFSETFTPLFGFSEVTTNAVRGLMQGCDMLSCNVMESFFCLFFFNLKSLILKIIALRKLGLEETSQNLW